MATTPKRPKPLWIIVRLVLGLAVTGAAVANYLYPLVRVSNDVANQAILFVALLVPVALLRNGLGFSSRGARVAHTAVFVVPAFAGFMGALLVLFNLASTASTGKNPTMDPAATIQVEGAELTVYALGNDQGLLVRSSTPLFAGLDKVRDLAKIQGGTYTTYEPIPGGILLEYDGKAPGLLVVPTPPLVAAAEGK